MLLMGGEPIKLTKLGLPFEERVLALGAVLRLWGLRWACVLVRSSKILDCRGKSQGTKSGILNVVNKDAVCKQASLSVLCAAGFGGVCSRNPAD